MKTLKEVGTYKEALKIMMSAAREAGCKLVLLDEDDGRGGYNYGGCGGKTIMLAPFVACKAGEKIGKYTVPRECSAPIQCMVISFFHELAHMIGKLPDKVGDSFCREIWAMAYGLEYAKEKYGLTFSDAAVAWKFRDGLTCFDTRKVRV